MNYLREFALLFGELVVISFLYNLLYSDFRRDIRWRLLKGEKKR